VFWKLQNFIADLEYPLYYILLGLKGSTFTYLKDYLKYELADFSLLIPGLAGQMGRRLGNKAKRSRCGWSSPRFPVSRPHYQPVRNWTASSRKRKEEAWTEGGDRKVHRWRQLHVQWRRPTLPDRPSSCLQQNFGFWLRNFSPIVASIKGKRLEKAAQAPQNLHPGPGHFDDEPDNWISARGSAETRPKHGPVFCGHPKKQ